MLNEEIASKLIFQFNKEIAAAYNYYSASSWCSLKALSGFQSWFCNQAKEELEHAHKLYLYLLARDYPLQFHEIPSGRVEFQNLCEIFSWGLELEIQVERNYQDLAELCLVVKDHTTYEFVQWFLKEQVEEIDTFRTFKDRLELIGENTSLIVLLDAELQKSKAD
ncbi:MAG: ferritin-like domain-containing protein [Deltaproteobacteria bacterium]|nr:ferritin-like domain-containing protein [Deltaproteobacteria bacterium]